MEENVTKAMESVNNNEKKQVNKVNAKKAQAQAKANKSVLDQICANIDTDLLKKGNKGVSVDIYRKSIYENCLPDEKKAIRRKVRGIFQGFVKAYLQGENVARVYKNFIEFYKAVYSVNDFSVNSVCGGKTDEQTRQIYTKFMAVMKTQSNK